MGRSLLDDNISNSTRRTALKSLGIAGLSTVTLSGSAAAHEGTHTRRRTGEPASSEPAADESEEPEEPESEDEEQEDEPEDTDSEVDESQYETVVDITEEGADSSGSSSILSTLREVADDDTLVRFPEGEYYIDGQLRITDYDRFGMVGPDATITVAPTDSYTFKLGTFRSPTTELHVEGFTVDISADNTGGRVFECQASESLHVSDITIEGEHDTPSKGPLLAGLRSSSGEGVVENYSAPDGGEDVSGGNGGTGLLVSHYHEGSITLRDCEIGPFPDNGIYCSNASGGVTIEGGLVRNANVAGVRLSGDTSAIEGTTFEYDEDIPGYDGQRAIRVDSGSDITISDIEVAFSDVSITEAIRVMSNADSVLIEDSTLDLDSSVRDAVSVVDGGGPVELDNVDASGYDRYELFEY